MTETEHGFTPPYGIPWRTFLNSLDHMLERTLPNRLDRSYLTWLPGLHQTYLMAAARGMGLTDAESRPTRLLDELVQSPEQRPAIFRELLGRLYPVPLKLAEQKSTTATLLDRWKDVYGQEGETRRKAITFFLQAARYADLELSQHWETGLRSAIRTARTNKIRKGPVKPPSTAPADGDGTETGWSGSGDSYTVNLRSAGGRVELRVNVDLFKISRTDREFVLRLVDALRDYDENSAGEPLPAEMPTASEAQLTQR